MLEVAIDFNVRIHLNRSRNLLELLLLMVLLMRLLKLLLLLLLLLVLLLLLLLLLLLIADFIIVVLRSWGDGRENGCVVELILVILLGFVQLPLLVL